MVGVGARVADGRLLGSLTSLQERQSSPVERKPLFWKAVPGATFAASIDDAETLKPGDLRILPHAEVSGQASLQVLCLDQTQDSCLGFCNPRRPF